MIDIESYFKEASSLIESRKRIAESAELIVWECREREKFSNNRECLNVAVNCMAYAKYILGYV